MTHGESPTPRSLRVLTEMAALIGRPAPAAGDDLVLTVDEFERLRRAHDLLSAEARRYVDGALVHVPAVPPPSDDSAPGGGGGTAPGRRDDTRRRRQEEVKAAAARVMIRIQERLGEPIPDELCRLASSAS